MSDLLPLPLYGAILVWLTWPLAAHLGTHLPGVARPRSAAMRIDTPESTMLAANHGGR